MPIAIRSGSPSRCSRARRAYPVPTPSTARRFVSGRSESATKAKRVYRIARPHHSRTALPPEWRATADALCRLRFTQQQIAEVFELSKSRVQRTVASLGLAKLKALEPPIPENRYERSWPGELIVTRGTSKSAVSRGRGAHARRAGRVDAAPARRAGHRRAMLDGIGFGEHARGRARDRCDGHEARARDPRGLDGERDAVPVAARRPRHSVFGAYAFVQRCQVHKKRNVIDHLPEHANPHVPKAMQDAYALDDADKEGATRTTRSIARRAAPSRSGVAARVSTRRSRCGSGSGRRCASRSRRRTRSRARSRWCGVCRDR